MILPVAKVIKPLEGWPFDGERHYTVAARVSEAIALLKNEVIMMIFFCPPLFGKSVGYSPNTMINYLKQRKEGLKC